VAQGFHLSYNGCLKRRCQKLHNLATITHTTKTVVRILGSIERKIEDVLEEDQFGFRRVKGARGAIGKLEIIPEQTLDIDKELCACFID
jgi:hypothetical protein